MTKRALTVGINAYPHAPLSGCVNDALDWQQALGQRGYHAAILLDDLATKANILAALRELVTESRFGDRIVFCYSGHGSWVPDTSGDETEDSRDEVICAYDYESGGLITDDEIREVFSRKRFGVRVTIISDSCFSGSVNRFVDLEQQRRPRYVSPFSFLDAHSEQFVRASRIATDPAHGRVGTGTGTVLLSGCSDEEYSWDAVISGRPNGAFTRTALDVLTAYRAQYGRDPSYTRWHNGVRASLPSSAYQQSPQMWASLWQRRWTL